MSEDLRREEEINLKPGKAARILIND